MRKAHVVLFIFIPAAAGGCDRDPAPRPTRDRRAVIAAEHILPPNPVGTLDGSLSVGADGSATYTMPLALPPPRRGVGPSLAVVYNSNGGEGILGPGFSLSGFSSIDRCPRTIGWDDEAVGVELGPNDQLCLDGQRLRTQHPSLPYLSDGMEYRPFHDPTKRVVAFHGWGTQGPTELRVDLPDGTVRWYGRTPDSQVVAPTTPEPTVVSWLLSRVQDKDGNYYTITYDVTTEGDDAPAEIPEHAPARIDYTGWDGVDGELPLHSVEFVYSDRFDGREGYRYGFSTARTRRLDTIRTFSDQAPVMEYRFGYALDITGDNERLREVSQCAATSSPAVCKPPTRFDWTAPGPVHPQTPGSFDPFDSHEVAGWAPSFPSEAGGIPARSLAAFDMNGDGVEDLAYYTNIENDGSGNWSADLFVRLGSRTRSEAFTAPIDTGFDGAPWWELRPFKYDDDLNVDLLWFTATEVIILRSSGTSFEEVSTGLPISLNWGDIGSGLPVVSDLPLVADMNGDGHEDLLVCSYDEVCAGGHEDRARCPGHWELAAGRSDGFDSWIDTGITDPCYFAPRVARVGDFDGDGRAELLIGGPTHEAEGRTPGDGAMRVVSWDAGAFTSVDTGLCLHTSLDPASACDGLIAFYVDATVVADFNGDGNHDLLTQWPQIGLTGVEYREPHIVYGTGSPATPFAGTHAALAPSSIGTFVAYTNLLLRYDPPTGNEIWQPTPTLPVDLSGDGRADYIQPLVNFYAQTVQCIDEVLGGCATWGWLQGPIFHFVSDGHAFDGTPAPDALWQPLVFAEQSGGYFPAVFRTLFRLADGDGDGTRDVVQFAERMQGVDYGDPGVTIHFNAGGVPKLVTRVTNGLGHMTDIDYGPLTDPAIYTPGTDCAFPVECVLDARYVVKAVFEDSATHALGPDGAMYDPESYTTRRYTYTDLRYDAWARASAGFASRTVTDDRTGRVTKTTYDNRTEYQNAYYPYAGLPQREVSWAIMEPSGFEERSSTYHAVLHEYQYQTHLTNGAALATRLVSETEGVYEGNAAFVFNVEHPEWALGPSSSSFTSHFYDNNGFEWQQFSMRGTTTDLVITPRSEDLANWLLGNPISRTHWHWSDGPPVILTTQYEYDPQGRLVRVTEDPGVVGEVTGRDRYGNATEVTRTPAVGATRVVEVAFAPDGTFPAMIRNSLGHEVEQVVHPGFGLLLSSTDANGLETLYRYDGFGRAATLEPPALPVTTIEWEESPQPDHVLEVKASTPGWGTSVHYLDRLGRALAERRIGFNGAWVRQTWRYDQRRRMVRATRPAFESGPEGSAVEYVYDDIGRPVTATYAPDRVEHNWYGSARRWHRDGNGNEREYVFDGAGRLAFVHEPSDSGGTTSYRYGPFGALMEIVDPAGNQTTIGFDGDGRVVSYADLDRGTTTFVLDSYGQPIQSTHLESGAVVDYERDDLGRLVSINDSDGVTEYTWDVAPMGIGHVVSMLSSDGVETTYAYDAFSRPLQESMVVDGLVHVMVRGYDSSGRPNRLLYPMGVDVRYQYDSYGNLSRIERAGGATIFEVDEEDAEGHIVHEIAGNGVPTLREYDPQTGDLLSILTEGWVDLENTGAPTLQALIDLQLDYDGNGNLTERQDGVRGLLETYTYDSSNRLRTATSGAGTQTWTYDALGNLTQSPLGTQAYGDPVTGRLPHAVHSLDYGGMVDFYYYDARGRMTSSPNWDIEYTSFDLPSAIESGGGTTTTFKYDAVRRRAVKSSPDLTIHYLGELFERRMPASGPVEYRMYVPANGRVVAEIVRFSGGLPESTIYHHAGPLGSTEASSNSNDNAIVQTYDPYGALRPEPLGAWSIDDAGISRRFTGHEHDSDLGLINMRGRMYSPTLGRFLTPDPIIQNVYDPRTLNAFSYVRNNPLNAIDPTGFQEAPLQSEPNMTVYDFEDHVVEAPIPWSEEPRQSPATEEGPDPLQTLPGTEAVSTSGEIPAAGDRECSMVTDSSREPLYTPADWGVWYDHRYTAPIRLGMERRYPTEEERAAGMSDLDLRLTGRPPTVMWSWMLGLESYYFQYADGHVERGGIVGQITLKVGGCGALGVGVCLGGYLQLGLGSGDVEGGLFASPAYGLGVSGGVQVEVGPPDRGGAQWGLEVDAVGVSYQGSQSSGNAGPLSFSGGVGGSLGYAASIGPEWQLPLFSIEGD